MPMQGALVAHGVIGRAQCFGYLLNPSRQAWEEQHRAAS